MVEYDLIIIGAGASGLLCAGRAASLGLKTAVLEKEARPGRKLLLSGGGKCNVANKSVTAQNYIGHNNKFCLSALARFAADEMPRRLARHGIKLEERDYGQIFCQDSASQVLDYLLDEMHGAQLFTGVQALGLHVDNGKFLVKAVSSGLRGTDNRQENAVQTEFSALALVIACGGPACPQCGATGDGFTLAKSLGHRIIPPAPALVPLIMPTDWALQGLAGISLPVTISIYGQKAPSFTLPMLFTHKGISGPAALQISCYWQKGQELRIDFIPGLDLDKIKENSGNKILRNLLSPHLPDRLLQGLLPERLAGRKAMELGKKDWREVTTLLREHQAAPSGTEGFKKAEACTGGVDVNMVSSSTMGSKTVAGLFFCGEALDICGQLGGYNLQWAWASGQAAADGARSYLATIL